MCPDKIFVCHLNLTFHFDSCFLFDRRFHLQRNQNKKSSCGENLSFLTILGHQTPCQTMKVPWITFLRHGMADTIYGSFLCFIYKSTLSCLTRPSCSETKRRPWYTRCFTLTVIYYCDMECTNILLVTVEDVTVVGSGPNEVLMVKYGFCMVYTNHATPRQPRHARTHYTTHVHARARTHTHTHTHTHLSHMNTPQNLYQVTFTKSATTNSS